MNKGPRNPVNFLKSKGNQGEANRNNEEYGNRIRKVVEISTNKL